MKGREGPALVELNGAADAQIGLNVGVPRNWSRVDFTTIDHDAITDRRGQRDGPRRLCL